MKKVLSAILGLFLLGVLAIAASASSFGFNDVDINGVNMDANTLLNVERGETITIRAEFSANDDMKDVRLKAEIGGYEYDDIDATSDIFDIESGVTYYKTLKLTMPEDMDASETYTLKLKLYNRNDEVTQTFDLRVKESRHLLKVQDVVFTPGLNINSNEPLFITVRVENLGDRKEEDVRVSALIPQLGIEQISYIDELSAYEEDSDDDETSQSADALYLNLRNAPAGVYDLIISVSYDRGHESITEDYQLIVGGAQVSGDFVVSALQSAQSVEMGEGAVYTINVANLGNDVATLTAEVSGLDNFANYRVDPATVNVQAGSEAEMFVYVSPKELGQKSFTVKVMQGGNVIKTLNLEVSSNEGESEWSNVLNGLAIGFLVLLIILVILGIIFAATKMSKKDSGEEALGESYY